MSFESNLKAALNGKKLDDLKDIPKPVSERIPVIPTPAMIMQVIEQLRLGTTYREIQLTITHQNRILTTEQIKTINRARLEKIAELSAPPEPEPKL